MEKKQYIAPLVECVEFNTGGVLCLSPGSGEGSTEAPEDP